MLGWMTSLADATRARTAAPGRAARADGRRAVRRAAAAAVDGEPASEGARPTTAGWRRGPRERAALPAGRRRPRPGGAPAVGAAARADGADARSPSRTTSASPSVLAGAADPLAGVLQLGRRAVGPAAPRDVRRALRPARRSPACSTTTGSSAISAAAPARSPRRWRRSCARVIAVDSSRAMLTAARQRLGARRATSSCGSGELEALPIDDGALDAAVICLVLHHVAEPPAVLREAARALRPGGRLLLVDMLQHDRARVPAADGTRLARLRAGADRASGCAQAGLRARRACSRCRRRRRPRARRCSPPRARRAARDRHRATAPRALPTRKHGTDRKRRTRHEHAATTEADRARPAACRSR